MSNVRKEGLKGLKEVYNYLMENFYSYTQDDMEFLTQYRMRPTFPTGYGIRMNFSYGIRDPYVLSRASQSYVNTQRWST